jgi:chlorobactene glucosyltransferase
MYRGARHVIAGFSKNLYEGLGGRPTTLAFVLALYLGCFVLPYAALFSSALLAPSPNPYALPALLGVAANVTLRALLAVRFRQPLEGILLHPLAVLALVGIALNSARWNLRRRIEWSGRSYLPRGEREART